MRKGLTIQQRARAPLLSRVATADKKLGPTPSSVVVYASNARFFGTWSRARSLSMLEAIKTNGKRHETIQAKSVLFSMKSVVS